ncbi:MAG: PD-(D/E)XK nuclease family protein [Caldiserica bacterium]|jgi:RecB family exonuclease|nr:PD-(D/E)XK nuclease family protein [Caldisericota bacterium]
MEARILKLTPSLVDIFESCPRRYWYIYEPDSPHVEKRVSWQLSFGNSLHDALKEIYNQGGPPRVSLASLPGILEKVWRNEGYPDGELEKEKKTLGLEILERYLEENRFRSVWTIELEKQFTATMEGVTLSARVDRLDLLKPGLLIVDYKTGQGTLSENQLYISYLVVRANYRSNQDRPIRFLLLNLERQEERLIDVEEEKALSQIYYYREIKDQIIRREFPPNPSLPTCRYCEAVKICPYARQWERE